MARMESWNCLCRKDAISERKPKSDLFVELLPRLYSIFVLQYGIGALALAAMRGHVEAVKYLHSKGFDLNETHEVKLRLMFSQAIKSILLAEVHSATLGSSGRKRSCCRLSVVPKGRNRSSRSG